MFAEPDVTNPRSNRILQQVGFQFIESIKMSYKTANLYVLTRDRFKSL
jgi:RimJ/RimL family protein N-acetyltransferase